MMITHLAEAAGMSVAVLSVLTAVYFRTFYPTDCPNRIPAGFALFGVAVAIINAGPWILIYSHYSALIRFVGWTVIGVMLVYEANRIRHQLDADISERLRDVVSDSGNGS